MQQKISAGGEFGVHFGKPKKIPLWDFRGVAFLNTADTEMGWTIVRINRRIEWPGLCQMLADTPSRSVPGNGPALPRPKILLMLTEALPSAPIQQALAPVCAEARAAEDLRSARLLLSQETWDLLVVDLSPHNNDALELLRTVQEMGLDTGLAVFAHPSLTGKLEQAVSLGVDSVLFLPVSAPHLRDMVQRCSTSVLRRRREKQSLAALEEHANALKKRYEGLATEMRQMEGSVLGALLSALAMREVDCIGHSLRVREYTRYFSQYVGYPEKLRIHLEHAALLHDIGKIGISDMLLFRSGVLTPAEVERMRPHVVLGEQVLERIGFLRPAAVLVRRHHERFDGTGFPDGLRGEEIPLGDRIFSIVDAYDALTTDRPYRRAMDHSAAIQELQRCSGSHFDPRLVGAFAQVPAAAWAEMRRQTEARASKLDLLF
jgi:response regulator RpfG family c-di-GMP phosphodiesterase